MTIYDHLTRWFCKTYGIERNTEYTIEYINPQDLLSPDRLDIVVKYKYVQAYLENRDMTYIKKVYKAHIEAFSQGTYVEPGQEKKKKNIHDYYKEFDNLIESMKEHGFDEEKSVVPINENNVICNGSHRVAIALYMGYQVPCIRVKGINNIANYSYFDNRLMPECYIDYLALEYCTIKKNIYAVLIWPRGNKILSEKNIKQKKVYEELATVGMIVLKKDLRFSYKELDDLVKKVYCHAPWLGEEKLGFPGSKGKTDAIYDKCGHLSIVLLEADSLQDIIDVKKRIRKYLKIENHSIHITDSYKETAQLIKFVFKKYNYVNCSEIRKFMLRVKRNILLKL